jgi:hypothetical protein
MKLLFALVALAIGTSAAWAGHRESCTTHCEAYGYCYTSCTGYDY